MHADQMTTVKNEHDAKRRDPESRRSAGEQISI
jgi:hypothetical protein